MCYDSMIATYWIGCLELKEKNAVRQQRSNQLKPSLPHWFESTKQRGGVCNPGVAFELFDHSAPLLWKCQLQPFALTADALNQALMP